MKIYIASSFSLIPKILDLVNKLELLGHVITVKWWERQYLKNQFAMLNADIFYAQPECEYAFNTDFKGIKNSDILILVADEKPRAYNGANIELGMVLAFNKKCFSLGNLENSAMYFTVTKCNSVDDLLKLITCHF